MSCSVCIVLTIYSRVAWCVVAYGTSVTAPQSVNGITYMVGAAQVGEHQSSETAKKVKHVLICAKVISRTTTAFHLSNSDRSLFSTGVSRTLFDAYCIDTVESETRVSRFIEIHIKFMFLNEEFLIIYDFGHGMWIRLRRTDKTRHYFELFI